MIQSACDMIQVTERPVGASQRETHPRMDDNTQQVIRNVSRTLCGARLRLPVAIWIRTQPEGTVFYQRQIANGIGTDARYLPREMQILEQLGMITPQPPRAGDVRRFYRADHTHPLWELIDTALGACTRLASRAGG